MSLTNAPFGFRPVRSAAGGNHRVGTYVASSASARIFKGDLVALQNSTGLVTRWATTMTERVLGVAAQQFNNSGTAGVAIKVYDDPNTVFQAQFNNATATTQVKFGNPFRPVTTTGDTTLGYSKMAVAHATSAASASYVVFALRLAPIDGNDLSAYSIIECTLAGDPTKIARA